MPVASSIAHGAATFRQNAQIFPKCHEGLTAEEWQRRPGDLSNSVLWIVGHVVWARSRAIALLGGSWSAPWLPLFERGVKRTDTAQYPSAEEVVQAWKDVSESLTAALENATEEALAAPAKPPSMDGKVSGMVNFLAYHETYHVGQAAYLRRWLGHEGPVG